MVKNPIIIERVRLNILRWFGHVQRMEENRIPKRVIYMNLGTTRLRGRPRNRWQDEVREDGRIVGGEGWQEKVYNREEWKNLLRTARNGHILHMAMEWNGITAKYWRILTNKEIYATVKKPTKIETIRLNRLRWFGHVQRMEGNRLRWFGHVQRMEGNRIHKRVLCMNLGTTRLRGRPRNRWQVEVREDGRIVGGEGWREKVYNGEECKKLLRTARNHRILHMSMELINPVDYIYS